MINYLTGVYVLGCLVVFILFSPIWLVTAGVYRLGKYYNEKWFDTHGRTW